MNITLETLEDLKYLNIVCKITGYPFKLLNFLIYYINDYFNVKIELYF